MTGGSLGVSTQKNEGDPNPSPSKSNSISFYPVVALFVRDNLALGVRGGYGGSTSTYMSSEQSVRNFSADLFARKYLPLGKGFYLFGEGNVGYFRNKLESVSTGSTGSSSIITTGGAISAYPGVSYAVSRRLQLEAALNNLLNISYSSTRYVYVNGQPADLDRSSGFTAGVGVGNNIPLNLGFRLFFGK